MNECNFSFFFSISMLSVTVLRRSAQLLAPPTGGRSFSVWHFVKNFHKNRMNRILARRYELCCPSTPSPGSPTRPAPRALISTALYTALASVASGC